MTPFTNIYDLALITMGDYKIKNLAIRDEDAFFTYMRSLLIEAIPLFAGCLQSLDYTSQEETDPEDTEVHTVYYFTNTLTYTEQSILAKAINIKWWEQNLQEVTVFKTAIPERDFTKIDVANGVKQKSEYKDKMMQELYQMINEYQNSNFPSLSFFGGL